MRIMAIPSYDYFVIAVVQEAMPRQPLWRVPTLATLHLPKQKCWAPSGRSHCHPFFGTFAVRNLSKQ